MSHLWCMVLSEPRCTHKHQRKRVWGDWELDYVFFSHLLLSHLQKQSSESHVTALCVSEPDISSATPLSSHSPLPQKILCFLSTPTLPLSLTDLPDYVASPAREKLPSTPPPLPQPPSAIPPREQSRRKLHKFVNRTPPPLSSRRIIGRWKDRKERGMLVLTLDKVPLPQSKQKGYHPQSTQKTKSNK